MTEGRSLIDLSAWRSTQTILEFEGVEYTGVEVWARAEHVARLLMAEGVKPQSTVMLSMHNVPSTIFSILGIWRLGAILVPVVPAIKASIVNWHDYDVRARWTAAKIAIVATSGELEYVRRFGNIAVSAAQTVSRPGGDDPLHHGHGELPAVIQFSSGSTGAPKAIQLSQANILHNARALASRAGMSASTVTYSWLPLHHDMGLMGSFLSTLVAGGRLVLARPRNFALDPISWARGVSQSRATVTGGPPFAYKLLIDRLRKANLPKRELDLSSLQTAFIGAERVEPAFYSMAALELGLVGLREGALYCAYGLAENTVAVTAGRPLSTPRRAAHDGRIAWLLQDGEPAPDGSTALLSCGSPLDGTGVAVVDDLERACPPGVIGRISISGSSLGTVDGKPAHESGDLGVVIENELYIVGREREMIKLGGRSIAPQQVEELIGKLIPLAHSVGVSSIYDESIGTERLLAIVETLRPHEVSREEVNREVIAAFGVRISEILVAKPGTVPRTSSGKMRRRMIPEIVLELNLRAASNA